MNLFSKMFTFDYSTQRTEGVQYIDKSGLSKALIDKLTPVKKSIHYVNQGQRI